LIRAVLVDLGDTLVHLNRPWDEVFLDNLESLYAFMKESGLSLDFQEFARIFTREFERASAISQLYKVEVPMKDIVSRVLRKIRFRDVSGTLVQGAIEEFYRPEVDAWQLFPDAVETLTALREMGLKMGLVSNSKSDWAVRAILEKHDLSKLFEVIVTSAKLRMRKPRLDIFTRALVALDAKPCETVLVGDSLQADIIGARSAGIRSIHVRRGTADHSRFVTPDVAVTSLSEALAQIISWNSASLEQEPSAA
jgi:HAD superfamily hydrolase (TIGR01662 family)